MENRLVAVLKLLEQLLKEKRGRSVRHVIRSAHSGSTRSIGWRYFVEGKLDDKCVIIKKCGIIYQCIYLINGGGGEDELVSPFHSMKFPIIKGHLDP